MSSLTTEQISELHDLALARLGEFDSVAAHFPKLVPGVVRIVIDVYEEWQAKAYTELCRAEEEAETPRIFEWHKQHLDYADTNGTIAVPDPSITAADLAAFEAVWPNIPDLQGEDIFAAEHGEPTGEVDGGPLLQEHLDATMKWTREVDAKWRGVPEPTKSEFVGIRMEESQAEKLKQIADAIGENGNMSAAARHVLDAVPVEDGIVPAAIVIEPHGPEAIEPPPLLAPLPDPVRVPVLSPQAAATLGPEHTAVSPLRPIGRDRQADANSRPRPLSVADAEAKRQAELAEIIAHLQSIAKGKRLPTMTDYHGTRPKHLPMWATMQSRHNLSSWQDLAALTGLTYGARHLRVAGDRDVDNLDDTNDDVDADDEIEPATDAKRKRPNGTRIKHPRKMGYEYGAESRPGRKAQAPETLPELIKAVQGMAMAGVMPTQSQFDTAKPVVWPRATSLMSRFNMSWEQLREMAGLKPNPRWGATWQQTDAAA